MNFGGTFLTHLHAARERMRPSERKLADLVLEAPERAVEMTMEEIAAQVGVSAPTVARFCAAAGCDGFREFKLRLAQDQGRWMRFAHPDVDDGDTPGVIAPKIIDGAIAALVGIRNAFRADQVEAAVSVLSAATRIEFYGSGNSGIVAQDIQHKIMRLGTPTVAYTDPHVFCMSALTLGPQDVAVVISNSGRTTDILEAATDVLSVGAQVVAITRTGSPLSEMSTVALNVDVSEDSEIYSPMASRLAHLVMGDVLAVALAQSKGDMARLRLQRSKAAVRRRRPVKDDSL